MADDDTIQMKMKILAELDQAGITDDLESLNKAIDSGLIKSMKEKFKAVEDVAKMKKSTEKDLDAGTEGVEDGSIKDLISLGGKALATLGIITAFIKAFESTLSVVAKLIEAIAQLFRPIADAMTILIIPIFSMLRPLIQILNVLMMPFRQVAMQGSAIAAQLIGKGTQMGIAGEEGAGEVLEAGVSGAVASSSLLLSGFMDVITKPLQDIEALGIGDTIKNSIDLMQDAGKVGVAEVMAFKEFFDDFETSGVENAVEKTQEATKKYINNIEDEIKGMDITEFSNKLGSITTGADKLGDALIAEISGDDDSVKKSLDAAATAANTFNTDINTLTAGFSDLNEAMVTQFKLSALERLSVNKEAMDKEMEDNKGFWSFLGKSMKNSVDLFLHPIKSIKEGNEPYSKALEEIDAQNLDLTESFKTENKGLWGQLSMDQKASAEDILGISDSYFKSGGENSVPDAFEGGAKKMLTSSTNFSVSMGKVATVAEDATKKIDFWSMKYFSAVKEIERKNRTIERYKTTRGIQT